MLTLGLAVLVAGAATGRPKQSHGVTLSTRQVISALASEGVGVYMSPSTTAPVQPVAAPVVPIKVLYPQAVLFAVETRNHSGSLGSTLSQAMPLPKAPAGHAYPGFDYLLAAYAQSTATPGEVLAGKLLGDVDVTHPDTVVFPDLIATLLSADALRAAGQGGTATSAASGGPARTAGAGSLCSALSDWVSHAYNSVFNALTVGASSNPALDFIGGLWNKAVSLAQSAISNVASALTGPVIGAIRTGLATAGLVSWAVSTFRNLQVQVSASPSFNKFGIDPAEGNTGKVTITLGKPGGWDWPSGIPECAQLLGVTLPSLNSVAGRTIQWQLIDKNSVPTSSWCKSGHSCYLAKKESADDSLASDHTASLTYRTNTETSFQAKNGTPITQDAILVSGTVGLNTNELADLIKKVLLGAVPGAVKVVVGPLFDTLTSTLQSQLAKLSQPKFFRYVLIDHHGGATLPASGCDSLHLTDDFPPPPVAGQWAPDNVQVKGLAAAGAVDATECSVTTYAPGGGYYCSATVNCQPLGAYSLYVFGSDEEAKQAFTKARDTLAGEPFGAVEDVNVGDEAAVSGDGQAGLVRVENDLFYSLWLPRWSDDPAPTKILQYAVSQLCPDCTFG